MQTTPTLSTGDNSNLPRGGDCRGGAGGSSSQGFGWDDSIQIGPTRKELAASKIAELKRKHAAKTAERIAAELPREEGEQHESALAGILLSPDSDRAFEAVHAAGIGPDHLTTPAGAIVAEILRLQKAGIPVDLVTVPSRLSAGAMNAIGEKLGLNRLVDNAPPVAYAAYHCKKIVEAATKRRLASLCDSWREKAANGITPGSLLEEIRKAIDHEDATTNHETGLEGDSLALLADSQIDAQEILLGSDGVRYLCRGGTMLFVGPSGVGKSTASAQQDILWALGRPAFGITPSRPLKIVTIQAENDRGDLIHMARGIMAALNLDAADRETVDAGTMYLSHNASTGADFLAFVDRVVRRYKPDLIRIDPLMAYAGGDLTKPETIAGFCRNGLNRIATGRGLGIVVCHHTPKMNSSTHGKQARQQWGAFDWQYAAAGGADLANWARAVMVIESLSRDVFAFRAAKRWPGWRDENGQAEHVRYFMREREHGKVYWHDATPADVAQEAAQAKGGKDAGPDLEALAGSAMAIVKEPMAPAVLKERIRQNLGLSKHYAEVLLQMLTDEGGKLIRWAVGTFPQRWLVGTPEQYRKWQSPALPSLPSLSSQDDNRDGSRLSCYPAPYKGGGKAGRQTSGKTGRENATEEQES